MYFVGQRAGYLRAKRLHHVGCTCRKGSSVKLTRTCFSLMEHKTIRPRGIRLISLSLSLPPSHCPSISAYMCTRSHIYRDIYAHIHIYTYIRTYRQADRQTDRRTDIQTHIHTDIHVQAYARLLRDINCTHRKTLFLRAAKSAPRELWSPCRRRGPGRSG